MSLQAQVILDLPTFLNVSEFADTIEINGDQVACVLVNDEAQGASDQDGVSLAEFTLYARVADFYKVPAVRQRVSVNHRQANIIRVDNEQGMYVIRLTWFQS
jgi:hypothetical protein